MCGSDICVVLYICVVQICVVLIYVWFTICVVQIYVCVEGLDIVMRSASPHCVPAVPQPYFPFIFAKPPPLLHFHFIFAKIQKTYLSYQIVDFLHMDFCAHRELVEINTQCKF